MKKTILQIALLLGMSASTHAQLFNYDWHTVDDVVEMEPTVVRIYNDTMYTLKSTVPTAAFDANPGAGVDMITDNGIVGDRLFYISVTDLNGNYLESFKVLEGWWLDVYNVEFVFASDGRIVLYGTSDIDINFNPEGTFTGPYSSSDIVTFVSFYTNAGAYVAHWEYPQSTGSESVQIFDAIIENDNLFLVGSFYGIIDFDFTAGMDIKSCLVDDDAFVSKINLATQAYLWTKTFGGEDVDVALHGQIYQNKLYVSGMFSTDSLDADPGVNEVLYLNPLIVNPTYNLYVSVFDLNGNYLDGFGLDALDDLELQGFTIDDSGNCYLYAANAQGDFIDFDPTAGTSYLYTSDNDGLLVAKYDQDLNFLWQTSIFTNQYIGPNSLDWERSTLVSGAGYLAVMAQELKGNVMQSMNGLAPNPVGALGVNYDLGIFALNTASGVIDTFTLISGDEIHGMSVAMSSNGDMISCGTIYGSVDFTFEDGITNPDVANNSTGYCLKLNWTDFTGLNEIANTRFNLYPNPCSDVLNIESSEMIESIRIMTLNGKVVIKNNGVLAMSHSINFDVVAGYYLVEVTSVKGVKNVSRIAIQ